MGKKRCGRQWHIGALVLGSGGISRYVVSGYGCLIRLDDTLPMRFQTRSNESTAYSLSRRIPGTNVPRFQHDSILSITGHESDRGHFHQKTTTDTTHPRLLSPRRCGKRHFGRLASLSFRRRQEKLGPSMRPQQGVEPLKFAIHLYNDYSCSLKRHNQFKEK